MKKVLIALVTAACFATALAVPNPADASSASRRFWTGVGVGVAGAALFGAAAHAHLAPAYHPYAPVQGYYYVQGPVYAAPPPITCPNGFWGYKVDKYGQPKGQPRWICPPTGYYATSYIYR